MARTLREEILAGLPLTDRELDVLAGAAKGDSAPATGERLYLSGETVKGYRKNATAKLAALNLTHAVAIAIGMGYISVKAIVAEHEARMAIEQGG